MTKLKELLDENCEVLSPDLNVEKLLDGIYINTIETTSKSALIYNLNSNKNIDLLEQRLSNCSYAVCFVNLKDSRLEKIANIVYVKENYWDDFQKFVLEKMYPVNWNNLKIIGVTGTNGKTTCVYLINQLLSRVGINVTSVGTLGVIRNAQLEKKSNSTSPSFVDNWKLLHFKSFASEVVAFEVSSHALAQNRFYDIPFDVALWTSFSQDHLDYHKTLDEYFDVKMKIKNLLKKTGKLFVCKDSSDIVNRILKKDENIELVDLYEQTDLPLFLKTRFNKINLTLSLKAIEILGHKIDLNLIKSLTPPPGRYNVLECNSNIVIIDYAHTPDALENITKAIKESNAGKKLITIFGCGGDRDKSKRPLMGAAASLISDEVVITSDNPRSEEPLDIINDILPGILKNTPHQVIADRKNAIVSTLNNNKNVIVLIAGKGHEDYMEIKGKRVSYSDELVVKEVQNDFT